MLPAVLSIGLAALGQELERLLVHPARKRLHQLRADRRRELFRRVARLAQLLELGLAVQGLLDLIYANRDLRRSAQDATWQGGAHTMPRRQWAPGTDSSGDLDTV